MRNDSQLYQQISSWLIFVPHEYFGFVRDYILRRIPEMAEVVYE